MSKKEKKHINNVEAPVHIDIPEDEIWTYQVEGLAPPHINKPYKNYTLKKIIFTLVILVAVSLSCYFSIRTVQSDTFEYKTNENGYELSRFTNTGYITELEIDYYSTITYDKENGDPWTNFKIEKNEDGKIIAVGAYALNCDSVVKVIKIGPEVLSIDSKAFYSCWAVEKIIVDENNPNYCDVDGVLYTKDMKQIIYYPCNHDEYLRQKYGYESEMYRSDSTEQYISDVQTYVVPSTVEAIGELCFAYANLRELYLPEGLKRIETLGVFKIHEPKDQWGNTPSLDNIYSYKAESEVLDPHFTSQQALGKVYPSLPEGLEFIGSDAFSYNQELSYLYIPSSVTHIGHHAFWDTVYKEDGTLKGVSVINVAHNESDFHDKTELGDSWRPQYDYMLFKKSVDVAYSAERLSMGA